MKPGLIIPLFSVLLAMFMIADSSTAEASEHIGISIGGGHHYYRGGNVIRYRTGDPSYNTWYPDYDTSYIEPPVYYSSPSYGYYSTPYIYTTPSVEFGAWFGSGGRRYYGHSGRYDRDHHRR